MDKVQDGGLALIVTTYIEQDGGITQVVGV